MCITGDRDGIYAAAGAIMAPAGSQVFAGFLLIILAGCDLRYDAASPTHTSLAKPTEQNVSAEPIKSFSEFTGQVIGVTDGDTVDVLTAQKQTIRIRLNGIDCPERGQPFGNNAKQFLSDSIGGKDVRVVEYGQDKYDRTIGDIYIRDELVNLSLVEAGLAWHYVKYAPDRSDLADAEQSARASSKGLWGGSHKPIPPWDWRKLSKEERDQHR